MYECTKFITFLYMNCLSHFVTVLLQLLVFGKKKKKRFRGKV